jgi:hypothetical protein
VVWGGLGFYANALAAPRQLGLEDPPKTAQHILHVFAYERLSSCQPDLVHPRLHERSSSAVTHKHVVGHRRAQTAGWHMRACACACVYAGERGAL